jgi:ABC-type lipoprotein release transport system permease subunit
MTLLRLAVRNLFRNVRRTAITAVAISFGLALMVFANNLAFGSYDQMIRTGVSTLAGHVVVQAKGWQEDRESDQVVTGVSALEARLRAEFPDATVLSRGFAGGLIKSSGGTVGAGVTAIQPDVEITVSDWHEKVADGEFLAQDDTRGIVLGSLLARSLDVETGDKVVFMTQGKTEVTSRLFRVRGTIETGMAEIDGFTALILLGAMQELLEQPDAASQISIHLSDPRRYRAAGATASGLVSDDAVEVLTWPEALPEMYDLIQLDRNSGRVVLGIIAIVVAFGVLNTVLMSVLERVREFGVMLAIGVRPRRLATLVVLESVVLGVASAALGVALGMVLTYPMAVYGFDFSHWVGESGFDAGGVAVSAVIKAGWDIPGTLVYALLAASTTVLASVYPALKAAWLEPVDAMRHV